nr:ATP-dependent DNA helicase PIF1-like [Tanacetum cinerariifolium]
MGIHLGNPQHCDWIKKRVMQSTGKIKGLKEGVDIRELVDDEDDAPEDEEGINIPTGRKTVTMREYYCYKFQIRPYHSLILFGGRLFQQFVVDTYVKIETSRLQFCEKNQSTIRVDLYQGIVDCVNAREVQSNRLGQIIVLPVSFIGGPRDMRRRFLDAMTLVQDAGKPDIFLTMTCNPNWPEIIENLYEGQTAQDRPDLVTRVFRFTTCAFSLDITSADKLENPDHYDKVVCVEIPDQNKQPELHQLVLKHIIHGPCGHLNTQCPCMEGEPKKCRWNYHRQFQETTQQGDDSYPLYRRRDNGIEFVTFEEDAVLTDILEKERNKRSMLTAFFELNQTDTEAGQYLYKDILKFYTWNKSTRKWNRRKQGKMRGRMVSANPVEGERFYLRVLLQHVKGPTGFDYLYTVNDVLYTTFRRAALERGLIKSDDYIHACLYYNLNCASADQVQNTVLTDISTILQSMGRILSDFDLPNIITDVRSYAFGCREVYEECLIVVQEDDILARHSLNSDQKNAYDAIMRHVDDDSSSVFFIDGLGGTGKTFLYKALLATVRSRGPIALATASYGAAVNNITGGSTAHSHFKIPINLTTNSICNIKKQSGLAKLLCQAKLIIWDETLMAKRQAVEAVDRTMQDITGVKLPFGGKIFVLGGDFRQVLPVVRCGTRAQIVDSSLRMSPLWTIIKQMRLTINMRGQNRPMVFKLSITSW